MRKGFVSLILLCANRLRICQPFQPTLVSSSSIPSATTGQPHLGLIRLQSTESLQSRICASLVHCNESPSVTSAARLGLSSLVAFQDFLMAITATQEFAVERLQYACAVLLGDMTNISSDVSGMSTPVSMKLNVSIILQRMMSLVTINLIQNEISMEGFLLESIMIQIAVSESFRSLRTCLISSDDAEDVKSGDMDTFGKTNFVSKKF